MSEIDGGGGLLEAAQKVQQTGFRMVGEVGGLFGALAKAQMAFKPIVRSKTVRVQPRNGPAYTFDYAPLESVIDATREGLAANGLALFQPLGHEVGGELILSTMLAHSSGAYLVTKMSLPQKIRAFNHETKEWYDRDKTAQEIGSAVTYMRRYMAQCILGVNAEEDDDGAQGEDMPREAKAKEAPRTAPTPPKVEKPKPAQQSAPPKPAEPKAPAEERTAPLPGIQADPATSGLGTTQQEVDHMRAQAQINEANLAQAAQAPQQLVGETGQRPPSTPPPAEGAKPSKESMNKMRALIAELGMQKMVPEWCKKILGVDPPQITLEAQIQTLIADLEQRKAATG